MIKNQMVHATTKGNNFIWTPSYNGGNPLPVVGVLFIFLLMTSPISKLNSSLLMTKLLRMSNFLHTSNMYIYQLHKLQSFFFFIFYMPCLRKTFLFQFLNLCSLHVLLVIIAIKFS